MRRLVFRVAAVVFGFAIIEGRFDAKFSKGCWGPKYHIAVKKIELLSPITDYNPFPTDGTPLRTRH